MWAITRGAKLVKGREIVGFRFAWRVWLRHERRFGRLRRVLKNTWCVAVQGCKGNPGYRCWQRWPHGTHGDISHRWGILWRRTVRPLCPRSGRSSTSISARQAAAGLGNRRRLPRHRHRVASTGQFDPPIMTRSLAQAVQRPHNCGLGPSFLLVITSPIFSEPSPRHSGAACGFSRSWPLGGEGRVF
jgi:hypothetical protein